MRWVAHSGTGVDYADGEFPSPVWVQLPQQCALVWCPGNSIEFIDLPTSFLALSPAVFVNKARIQMY